MAVFVVRKKAGDRFVDKSSRVQKWQMFSESDRRGIVVSVTLSGCTSEKARSLRLAAVQFKNESLAAIEAIEAMHQRELAPPARSLAEVRSSSINNILAFNKPLNSKRVDFAIDPSPKLDPRTQDKWSAFINKLNTQYEALAAIYDQVEGGSLLASKAVQKSAEHAEKLTLQMAAFATVIDKHPPIFFQERIVIIAGLEKLRQEYQQKQNNGESDENLQLIRDRVGELLDKWQQVRSDEQKLRDTTVAQCLKAAVLGKELSQLIERYNELKLDDLNSLIARILDTTAAITGRDYASLKVKATSVFAEIQNDEIWSKAANTVLEEVNKAAVERNRGTNSLSSSSGSQQGSNWLNIIERRQRVAELKLLIQGRIADKTLGIEALYDSAIQPHHLLEKNRVNLTN